MLNVLNLSKPDKEDVVLSLLALVQPLLAVTQILLSDSQLLSVEKASFFRVGLSAFVFAIALPLLLKRSSSLLFRSYIIILFLYLISLSISSSNLEYIGSDGLKLTVATCIPVFVAISSIKNLAILKKTFYYLSIATMGVGVVYALMLIKGLLVVDDFYNMTFGYAMLLPMMLFWFSRKKLLMAFSVILATIIFFVGSRGPFVVFLCYIIWDYFKSINLAVLLIGTIFFLLVYLNFESILNSLEQFFGFQSRTIWLLLNGELLTHSSGRDGIYDSAIAKIYESPILGYGVFGSRTAVGGFPHNIFLEIFLDFGIIIGFFVLLFIVLAFISTYLNLSREEKPFFVMLSFACLLPLLVSGSYIMDYNFFMFLGIIFLYRKKECICYKKLIQ